MQSTLTLITLDGADKDYADILLPLLDEKWHISDENIVSMLEEIPRPEYVDKLYKTAINVPDDDETRALAKKCTWVLSAIGTPEAIEKLILLKNSDDEIISENAAFHLSNIANER
ncbi:hypothetical protein [Mucilaginibacter sp. BT774]|uniref:hypothetical protein n=1 Tax=Mucilaginibacter sp. BT774 TaxID=3062276 RepID=UPI00267676CF|nr:hypothetical protein [Mucilaginibacter sp. BT774]MDO3625689.1 hypothetical protein [Mucilaginibacter sp. BT774]